MPKTLKARIFFCAVSLLYFFLPAQSVNAGGLELQSVYIDEVKKQAQEGKAEAQYELALMYIHGDGVKQDKKQARFWLEKSANQGYEKAQEALKNLPK